MIKKSSENPVRLILPPAIYSVPGHEINIYFDNTMLVPNIANYNIDVECGKGRQFQHRWQFVPDIEDIGSFPIKIKVIDGMNNEIAVAVSTVYVTPPDAGKGNDISLLMIGDSLTDHSIYPREVSNIFKASDNPRVTFIGSHSGGGRSPHDGIAHEGYGGWAWRSFCTTWNEKQNDQDYRYQSKFLRLENGKPILDVQHYCDQYNQGKSPDYITIFLGHNDIFAQTEKSLETAIDEIFKYADEFLTAILTACPKTKIGILLPAPPTASQDAFGVNYQCSQSRWQYRRNQHRLVERMLEKFSCQEQNNIYIIPSYVNFDCINGYPMKDVPKNSRNLEIISCQNNALHPAKSGYFQIADSIYYWLKFELNK